MTIKSRSLDRGLASVDGEVLGNTSGGGVDVYWAAEESQTDVRQDSKETIRNAGVGCVRDRTMNLKRKVLKISNLSRRRHLKIKSFTL